MVVGPISHMVLMSQDLVEWPEFKALFEFLEVDLSKYAEPLRHCCPPGDPDYFELHLYLPSGDVRIVVEVRHDDGRVEELPCKDILNYDLFCHTRQFEDFCKRLGIPMELLIRSIHFVIPCGNPVTVEQVYRPVDMYYERAAPVATDVGPVPDHVSDGEESGG